MHICPIGGPTVFYWFAYLSKLLLSTYLLKVQVSAFYEHHPEGEKCIHFQPSDLLT